MFVDKSLSKIALILDVRIFAFSNFLWLFAQYIVVVVLGRKGKKCASFLYR